MEEILKYFPEITDLQKEQFQKLFDSTLSNDLKVFINPILGCE